ncbi:hypothetical protein Avbf_11737 [Armadillidium vulgare]|nr:hypothetical protein Avbf_11737 [Armadillidium vulgare]
MNPNVALKVKIYLLKSQFHLMWRHLLNQKQKWIDLAGYSFFSLSSLALFLQTLFCIKKLVKEVLILHIRL